MALRLDRIATLYVMSPLKRCLSNRASVPILMYHSISEQDESGVHPYYRTATSPKAFASQMQYLRSSGYSTVSLAEVVKTICDESTDSKQKKIAITFDDGYADFYREAFPILSRLGFTATMFLATGFVGNSPLRFKEKDCLTWGEVRELQKHGVVFGSHTVTHPQLCELGLDLVKQEIVNSKQAIEQQTSVAVESFAYPYAFPQTNASFIRSLRETLVEAGYKNGVCTLLGRANQGSNPFFMERLPVNSSDDLRLFQAKLEGAYDWVAGPQLAVKTAKRYLSRFWSSDSPQASPNNLSQRGI